MLCRAVAALLQLEKVMIRPFFIFFTIINSFTSPFANTCSCLGMFHFFKSHLVLLSAKDNFFRV